MALVVSWRRRIYTWYIEFVFSQDRLSKQQEYIRSMQDWYSFKGETKEFYGIDMSVLEVRLKTEMTLKKMCR